MSHKYTNYSAVQELHRKGHEVGVFSITRKQDPKYWTKGTYDDWLAEMAGDRLIIERFANITDGTVIGVRAPYLRVGGNTQFQMMNDQFFVYDSSIAAQWVIYCLLLPIASSFLVAQVIHVIRES